ncbi:MBOAT family O-acyltransferase [Velocimicrobium porci]|uniref:MBOAT family protein n=1 Tax=Velocimicrobium porci TaxID=2606634 RepID=A0A6L5Y1N3_9FIRM|nr:MBOAT family O-acyltransferase [Velocimicrobium porci]MSS64945.1 MBOAT family protein [Velocimicrobium porci]
MLFSSLLFIFQFMPIFFLIYYIIPVRFRNVFLFGASLFFYAWGEPYFLLLILLSILVNYVAGLLLEKNSNIKQRKFILVLSLIYNLGMLGFFKYSNFFVENLNYILKNTLSWKEVLLPLGISFYTFQIMSYTIDVYRRKVEAESSFVNLGTYLCMFPQLIAGPIVVYTQVSKELKERTYSLEQIEEGLKVFVLGLGSKVLLANNIGNLWNDLGELGYSKISMPLAWLGAVSFALQIYFDFHGYSLMAIGLGKMMGFEFPKNFNYPYISKSMTEFWRRWHITLGSWFREYLYIPLGGNRKGKGRLILNLLLVWSATGFWHGASWNFLLWGIFFFVLLTIEKLWMKEWLNEHRVISRIYFLVGILVSWIIFAVTDLREIGTYIRKMFSFTIQSDWIYYIRNYGLSLMISILFATPVVRTWYQKTKNLPVDIVIMTGIFLLSVAYLVDAAYNPFLYFRF